MGDTEQNARKSWHGLASVVAVFWWEVGTTIKRATIRHQKDGHGPTALTRHGLYRLHVDTVDIGPFLAVNLDIDKVLVHQCGNLFVLKRLALHHMTPVTRRITNTQQNGLVLLFRLL